MFQLILSPARPEENPAAELMEPASLVPFLLLPCEFTFTREWISNLWKFLYTQEK